MPKTSKARRAKPEKPYLDFPLFAHATGWWVKKVRGKLHYFGKTKDGWQASLENYQRDRDDLHAGRTPRSKLGGLVLADLLDQFLVTKDQFRETGEITQRTFADYKATCDRLIAFWGKQRLVSDLAADDFQSLRRSIAKTYGPVALGNAIQRVRSIFKYGYDVGLIDRPMRFGPGFNRPSKKTLRLARHAKGEKLLSAEQLQTLIDAADQPLKSMIMLGLNCGFGNADVGTLPIKALDLRGAWLNFPRPKTGIQRRCPLWPETVRALREAIKQRPTPKDNEHAGRLFITKYGKPWSKATCDNPVTKEMVKLLQDHRLHRPGWGFYLLRHVFETIAGESRDQVAVNSIMGHADQSMAAAYREKVSDERLRAVADHVHDWLYATAVKKRKAK